MTTNQKLLGWVADMQKICKPDAVVWIHGDKAQLDALREEACATGEIARCKSCAQNFHLHPLQKRRRAHEQLDGSAGGLSDDVRAV